MKKALISPLRERYDVDLAAGGDMEGAGQHRRPRVRDRATGGKVAEVGKRWFRVRDTYGIEVAPGQDDALVLAVAVVVDAMSHKGR